ncbi:TPA: hypothetical protein QC216_004426 [Bacillus cereus]|nr:hypothetical protein [Bacillus cereus]HDR8354438.1 hypothetical protein [Bacillus cereus]HDR8360138.1 hypothetical protein [Bacillus cereus]HDR8381063.1 hypothetical protein [Bacillus cereus]
MSIDNEEQSNEQVVEEYVKKHFGNIQSLLDDLNILIKKHMETLNEETFFAVWNDSPLSKKINENGITMHQALLLIAEEGIGIKVIKGAWD